MNVLELDEVISKMTLQLKLTVEWIDSRLEYVDLKRPVFILSLNKCFMTYAYLFFCCLRDKVFLFQSYQSNLVL